MSSGRCYRRKMMGRGAEGGCGTEEKPCPASRASSNAAASTATRVEGVNLYAQARKALSEHSPFEEPEELARISTLPVGLATSLFKSLDGRRKHKKLQSDSIKKVKVPSAQQATEAWSLWSETEEYFRPITLSDIDILAAKCQFGGSSPDSCFTIPKQKRPTPVAKEEFTGNEEVEHENMDVDALKSENTGKNESFELDNSLNWILGSKQRILITSERPNKKRKLTGFDAGFKNLMLLPNALPEGSRICDYCCSGDDNDAGNRLLQCNSCKVSVHMKCYGVQNASQGTWTCSCCRQMESSSSSEKACILCPKKKGALKIVGTNVNQSGHALKFAHLFCSLWIPGVFVDDIVTMEPIMNAEGVQEMRKILVCSICKANDGTCIRCGHGACQTSFHPICARDAKLRMEIWGKGKSDDVELLVFCSKHSTLHDICAENLSATSTNKVPRIRISSMDREKSSGNEEGSTVRDKSDGGDVSTSEQSCDMNNGSSDINDLLMILKKLSNRGKVRVPEIASDMGIPSELLDPIIEGQTSSISSELKLKIISWFQNYVHLGGPTRHSMSVDSVDVGSVLVKSLPSRRRTKSDVRVLRDHKVVCPAGDRFVDDDCKIKVISPDSIAGEDVPPVYESDYTSKVREILQKMEDGVSYSSEVHSSAMQPQQCNGNGNTREPSEYDVTTVSSGAFTPKTEPHPGSHVHPFIQKKLRKINHILSCRDEVISPMETDLLMKNCSNQSLRPMNDVKFEKLAKSMSADVMESIPEDEVEGEILYFQNKLLDTVVAIKQSCEKLMQSIISLIPKELDSLRKQRWDSVSVNQYMRHLKEAKKRGRKEKRHKEFQEVLAAAAAATEASSRGSSQRKEKDGGISPLQETGGRASQVKDAHLKSSMPKVAFEKRSDVPGDLCDICGRPETMLNKIFICGGCKVAVHLDCYRRPRSPINSWSCEVCEESSVAQCGLCGSTTGAFRKSISGQWVHNLCAEWVLQSTFSRGQEDPVEGVEVALLDKESASCGICHQKSGICIKCSQGDCLLTFHPFCAKRAGFLMITKNIDGKMHHNAYCEKHGDEQKLKADVRQYSAEELRSIKQIRVELEKVRLLCERIIRREKLKRDLVICSHEILASKRDYVEFSSLVDSGVSSESATTSLRSDDVTIDSSLSSKRGSRVSIKPEHLIASARKGVGKMALTSGKSIPRKSMASSSALIGGDQKLKPRKHPEIFQKEVVMTSDQASVQNKRLPKGFVYVPVDSLSKSQSTDSVEPPRRPDG